MIQPPGHLPLFFPSSLSAFLTWGPVKVKNPKGRRTPRVLSLPEDSPSGSRPQRVFMIEVVFPSIFCLTTKRHLGPSSQHTALACPPLFPLLQAPPAAFAGFAHSCGTCSLQLHWLAFAPVQGSGCPLARSPAGETCWAAVGPRRGFDSLCVFGPCVYCRMEIF